MAELQNVKAKIQGIAKGNRKNVTLEDIEWVTSRFKLKRLQSNEPGPGRCYVDSFIKAMIELGLYED